jgi:hypothetical protein
MNAQELRPNGTPSKERFGFGISYYGYKFKYPGLQLSAENYLATTKNFQVIAAALLQTYWQKEKQSAVAFALRFGQRYTTSWGLMLESYLGIGMQETYYKLKSEDLTTSPPSESIDKVHKFGAIGLISIGLGYDFSKKTKLPFIIYGMPTMRWLYPDQNLIFVTNSFLEIGVIYKPSF